MTSTSANNEAPLFTPSAEHVAAARMTAFRLEAEALVGHPLPDYAALHAFSIDLPEAFWGLVWDFCGVIGERGSDAVLRHADRMPGAVWFPDAKLNFAENLLRRRDAAVAVVFRGEGGERRTLSFAELHASVARTAAALRARGVGAGDRVAGVLANTPEALVAALATASLGGVWSSCSPDFGTAGVVDRFEQIEPKVLFFAAGYSYGGKSFDVRERLAPILEEIPSITWCVVLPPPDQAPESEIAVEGLTSGCSWQEFVSPHPGAELAFTRLPFAHPLYILFSSGTTGKPKCIVHSAGGTLLQHLKEHQLHVDLNETDRLFYFTTCGWMMWNWLVSGLASGASLVLFDGAPAYPDPGALFRIAEEEEITAFGTSAKFLDAVAKAKYCPRKTCDLSSLRILLSTGSPLAPEGFDFVAREIREDLHVASISGGTDIISCFVLGNPAAPVWRGEIQAAGLGMKVEVFDDQGAPLHGEPGELCCTAPFPSMPVGFYGDPDGTRYRAAYFDRWPGVWRHGDWIRETPNGGYIITGRSDAVLNPGGVRIGTSEIYRAVEAIDDVVEAIAVGQAWDDDVRVVLFVTLRAGRTLDDALRAEIRSAIRAKASPRHVPAVVLEVADIPRTRSGKITELAVRAVIHGRAVENREALANPEALDEFRDRPELAS